jgi:hypothetical protein
MSKVGLKVRNKEEAIAINVITKAHEWLNKKFGVDTNLTFSREVNWGRDADHAGFYSHGNKEVRINIRNLYGHTIHKVVEVLGHEIRHAIQHKKKWLVKESRWNEDKVSGKYESGKWKGKDYHGKYLTAPWEIDAREYQTEYADMVIEALKLEKDSKVKLPYGSVSVKLKDETIAAFMKKNKSKDIQLLRAYDKKGKSNPNGFWWIDLKQTTFKLWDRETIQKVYDSKKYRAIMEKQFVPYETKKQKFGGIDLIKMIF